MGRLFRVFGMVVLLVIGGLAAIYFTGNTLNVIVWFTRPTHGWDLALKAPAPDYAKAEYWAATPGKPSYADFAPQGVVNEAGERKVDVFFVHPTGNVSGAEWNSQLDPDSRTEENTKWMMANQASAFSGCCNIYAPRYREASVFIYLSPPPDIPEKALDFAYADVERAFQYYIEHNNHGRPFIIASHSQGTRHAFRLIRNLIDGKPLEHQMVVAYLIGHDHLSNSAVATLKSVRVCDNETELGCIVHWATVGEGGKRPAEMAPDMVCVNPLNWRRDGGRAPASLHRGGVPMSGRFSLKLWGDDRAEGVTFEPLKAPIPNHTWAECRNGLLTVADQTDGPFGRGDMGGKNYHGLDYPLFHMDVRANAAFRLAAYFKAAGDLSVGTAATSQSNSVR